MDAPLGDLLKLVHDAEEQIKCRIAEVHASAATDLKLAEQLERYGVCNCVAMGRWSTCCGKG
jgi:hypothetical protein